MGKPSPINRSRKATPEVADPIARRIRERRTAMGLTLSDLAERSGLRAPSYIFHIENGHKVPSEEIAARIAKALGDDVELYRAWVHARNRADLPTALAATDTLRRLLGKPVEGHAAGDSPAPAAEAPLLREAPLVPEASSRLRSLSMFGRLRSATEALEVPSFLRMQSSPRVAAPASPENPPAIDREVLESALFRVPVYSAGIHPGDERNPRGEVLETLRLDARLLMPLERVRYPFAYRIGAAGAPRAPDLLEPGDLAVFSREFLPLSPEAAYAVCLGGRVELARVFWDGVVLHLLPAAGGHDVEALPAAGELRLRELVLGRVIMAIRRWV